jgi:iron complex transport system ATP-binding protein
MSGVLAPEKGVVELEGKPLGAWTARERARRVAVVHQEHESMLPVRVEDAVWAGRTPYGSPWSWESPEDVRVVKAAMEEFQVTPLKERWMHTLSSGERQRVWMAMAMTQQPKLIYLDEPTIHLDLKFQSEVMNHILRLRGADGGVVWVSHDLNLAVRYCTRLIALADGEMIASGPPEAVVTEETLNRLYGAAVAVERARDGLPMVIPRYLGRSPLLDQ